jgi:hypothetical protein
MILTHSQGDEKRSEKERLIAEYLGPVTKDGKKSLMKCKKCDSVVIRGFFAHFKKHIETVHEKTKVVTCDKCGQSFNNTDTFKNHMLKVHKIKRQDVKMFKELGPVDLLVAELFENFVDEATGNPHARCKTCDRYVYQYMLKALTQQFVLCSRNLL